jgi:hypothetical protein
MDIKKIEYDFDNNKLIIDKNLIEIDTSLNIRLEIRKIMENK